MTTEKSEDNNLQKLKTNLLSNSEDTVLKTLDKIRDKGEAKILPTILDLLADTDNPEIEAGIIQLLFDLKNEDSVPYLIAALNNQRFKHFYSYIISAFWQSSLDGSAHLSLFVNKAIKGDYMICLEALTVIENFESGFSSEEIQDCSFILTEAIEKEKQQEKKELLKNMLDVVLQLGYNE